MPGTVLFSVSTPLEELLGEVFGEVAGELLGELPGSANESQLFFSFGSGRGARVNIILYRK